MDDSDYSDDSDTEVIISNPLTNLTTVTEQPPAVQTTSQNMQVPTHRSIFSPRQSTNTSQTKHNSPDKIKRMAPPTPSPKTQEAPRLNPVNPVHGPHTPARSSDIANNRNSASVTKPS